MTAPFLPYGRQTIEPDDIAAVAAALGDDFLTTGPRVARFEAALAARVGGAFAVVCSSGTAALHLAMHVLDLASGDAVVVPAITFVATANAVRLAGAEVVFSDVDPDTGLMTADHLEDALTRTGNLRPRAVIPVHLAGQCADPTGIRAVAERHGMTVVEDACHALGTTYGDGGRVGDGRDADMTCFSFHPVKAIAVGEGGAITLGDGARAARLRRVRAHGIEREAMGDHALSYGADGRPNPWSYEMPELGLNYRLPDLACALGLSQLGKLDRFLARRAALVAHYDRMLEALAPRIRPLSRASCAPGWHLMVVLIDFAGLGVERANVMRRLREAGIGTQVHYIPVPWQPYYRARYGASDLPGAARYYARALTLPLHPAMTEADATRVVATLAEVLDLA